MHERKLGKGLDVLFADAAEKDVEARDVQWVHPDRIQPNPSQPRKAFSEEALDELKRSISKDGILQPVLVRAANGGYELIAGERRWRAAKELGMDSIPTFVRGVGSERSLELALVENIQRTDLNPIDLALAYRDLQDQLQITQEEVAERVGKKRSTVANTIRLLDLPEEIRLDVSRGTLSPGHARAILALKDVSLQRQVAVRVVKKMMSVRETERLVSRLERRSGNGKPTNGSGRKDPVIQQWEEALQGRLGTKVRIQEKGKSGKGRICIEFFSPTDFERILGLLGVA
jgi:ParB family chromosome partitioning protein